MPRDDAEYVVIGLTNGPGFYPNPCLADQVAYAQERGLLVAAYSVISWPDEAAQAQYGGLQEAGRAQAQFNLQSMKAAGLDSPIIWLDVEPVPHYEWTTDTAANAEVVLGAAQGYADAGYRIGVYSTPAIWAGIVGDLSLGVPEWRAAGQTSQEEALSRCGTDWLIQGGVGGARAVGRGRAGTATSPARAPRPSWATTSGNLLEPALHGVSDGLGRRGPTTGTWPAGWVSRTPRPEVRSGSRRSNGPTSLVGIVPVTRQRLGPTSTGSGLAPYPTSIDSTEVSDSAGTTSSKLLSGAHTVVPARPSASRNARWVRRRNSPADGVGALNREWVTRTHTSRSRQP